jgi:hypothetical protein
MYVIREIRIVWERLKKVRRAYMIGYARLGWAREGQVSLILKIKISTI